MMKFNNPALVIGTGTSGDNIAFLAEPSEKYEKNEIFSYFSEECTKLTVIPLTASFTSPAERNFVVNHILDELEQNTQSEYLECSFTIDRILH